MASIGGPSPFTTAALTGAGNTATFSAAQAHRGATSIKLHLAPVAGTNYFGWDSQPASAQAFGRCYLYLTANPTTTVRVMTFVAADGTARVGVRVNTDNTLSIRDSAGTIAASSTATVPLNQWIRVELDAGGISGTTGTVSVRAYWGGSLDNTQAAGQINFSSAGVNVGGTVGGLYFGAVSSTTPTAAFDYWFDDCAYATVPLDIPAAQWVDLWLSTDGGATTQLYATQQPTSGSWIFRTPASGIDYSVQAVAHANQSAAAASPWVR